MAQLLLLSQMHVYLSSSYIFSLFWPADKTFLFFGYLCGLPRDETTLPKLTSLLRGFKINSPI